MKEILRDKIRGAILGVAYGDALGAPIEKLSHEEILEKYGEIVDLDIPHYQSKSLEYGKGYGRITDDTLLTIKLCEIYKEKKDHLDAYDMFKLAKKIYFEETWIPEYQKNSPLIDRLFFPEKYIFLRLYLANVDPRNAGFGNMVNCGAAMYMTPVGIVNAADPENAYKEAIDFASAHQHSYGLEAAGVYAACVAAAFIPNISMRDIFKIAIELAKDGTKMAIEEIFDLVKKLDPNKDNANILFEVISKYSNVGDSIIRDPDKVGFPSESYTPSRLKSIEELPIALAYSFLYEKEPMKAISKAVSWGRDTDSIGVMTGGIMGAIHGWQIFPKTVVEKLKEANKYDFINIADNLFEIVKIIHRKDFEKSNKIWEYRRKLNS